MRRSFILLLGVWFLTGYSCREYSHPIRVVAPVVQLTMPDTVTAGHALPIHLHSTPASPGLLVMTGSWGTRLLPLSMVQDTQLMLWPHSSGRLLVQWLVDRRVIAHHTVQVLATGPAGPLDAYLGPKALVAGSGEKAWLSIAPQDSLGNKLPDGLPLQITLLTTNQQLLTAPRQLRHGMAFLDIAPGIKSGKILAGVRTSTTASFEKELGVVAAPPVPFGLTAGRHTPFADGRQTFRVFTSILTDRYGNTVSDGYHVRFYCEDADSSIRIINAYTISGVATIFLQQPAIPGTLSVQAATPDGRSGKPLALSFRGVLDTVQLRYAGGWVIAGPLVGIEGELLPDGRKTTLRWQQQQFTTTTDCGYARFPTGPMPMGSTAFELQVAGQIFHQTIKINHEEP